jgi:cytochrome c peroxidase
VTAADALAQDCWPPPEVSQRMITLKVGNLHLTEEDEANLVAFLKALTDRPLG